jgi:hypothetical protein
MGPTVWRHHRSQFSVSHSSRYSLHRFQTRKLVSQVALRYSSPEYVCVYDVCWDSIVTSIRTNPSAKYRKHQRALSILRRLSSRSGVPLDHDYCFAPGKSKFGCEAFAYIAYQRCSCKTRLHRRYCNDPWTNPRYEGFWKNIFEGQCAQNQLSMLQVHYLCFIGPISARRPIVYRPKACNT